MGDLMWYASLLKLKKQDNLQRNQLGPLVKSCLSFRHTPMSSCPPSARKDQDALTSKVVELATLVWHYAFFNLCNLNTIIFPEKGACPASLGIKILGWALWRSQIILPKRKILFVVCVYTPLASVTVVQKIRLLWNQVIIIAMLRLSC